MLQRSAGKVTKLIRSQNKLSDIIEKLMKTLALSKVVKKYLLPKFTMVRLSTRNGSMRLKKKN